MHEEKNIIDQRKIHIWEDCAWAQLPAMKGYLLCLCLAPTPPHSHCSKQSHWNNIREGQWFSVSPQISHKQAIVIYRESCLSQQGGRSLVDNDWRQRLLHKVPSASSNLQARSLHSKVAEIWGDLPIFNTATSTEWPYIHVEYSQQRQTGS